MFFTSLQLSVVSKSSRMSMWYSYSFEYDEKVKFFMLNNVRTLFFFFGRAVQLVGFGISVS